MAKVPTLAAAPEPLPTRVVDNHTHLESIPLRLGQEPAAGGVDVTEYLTAAHGVGVDRIVQVGCDVESARASLDMPSGPAARLRVGVALHPNEVVAHHRVREESPDGLAPTFLARHEIPYDEAFAEISDLARHSRVCTIAETGLDYFRAGERGRAWQRAAFRDHIALAKELGLPMQIHDRDAHADVLQVLDADGAPEVTILHSFSGDAEFAEECLRRGFFLSFSGTVTFKNARDLRQAAVGVPADRLLVETDAPYLTPEPNRGRVNAPFQLPHTIRFLADLREEALEGFCSQISRLSERLYGPF